MTRYFQFMKSDAYNILNRRSLNKKMIIIDQTCMDNTLFGRLIYYFNKNNNIYIYVF